MLHDGIEALEYIRNPASRVPKVLLLDMMLPGKSGLDVMREGVPQCPVIAMTGNVGEDSRAEYARLAFDAVLPKPFNLQTLQSAMADAHVSFHETAGGVRTRMYR